MEKIGGLEVHGVHVLVRAVPVLEFLFCIRQKLALNLISHFDHELFAQTFQLLV